MYQYALFCRWLNYAGMTAINPKDVAQFARNKFTTGCLKTLPK
jgi:hypothetical protein